MRMDKTRGGDAGCWVGLQWETLGVGVYALLQENGWGGDGGSGGVSYINVLHRGAPT